MSQADSRKTGRLRKLVAGALLLLGIVVIFTWQFYRAEGAIEHNALDVGKDFPIRDPRNEESGLCPWRQPATDQRQFFPEYPARTTVWRDATLILTHDRPLLARLLKREPTAQENAIQVHRLSVKDLSGSSESKPETTPDRRPNSIQKRIRNHSQTDKPEERLKERSKERPAGIVITRCIAGESGLIELVLAVEVNAQGKAIQVRGARLQRLREPENVAHTLQSPAFLGAFRGKTAHSEWKMGRDLPTMPDTAVPSAQAIVEGARAALILLSVGEQQLRRTDVSP